LNLKTGIRKPEIIVRWLFVRLGPWTRGVIEDAVVHRESEITGKASYWHAGEGAGLTKRPRGLKLTWAVLSNNSAEKM
jgi:hypothetical protein